MDGKPQSEYLAASRLLAFINTGGIPFPSLTQPFSFLKKFQMHKKVLLISSALAAAVLMSACGKKDEAPSASSASSPASKSASNVAPSLERRSPGNRSYSFIDMSWQSLPDAEHQKVRAQIRDLYWSGAVKNPEKLAEDFLPAYRRETDAFKKADMIKATSGELDQGYANAQKVKDYAVKMHSDDAQISIQPYDAQIGGFKVYSGVNQETRGVGIKKDSDPRINNQRWYVRFVGVPYQTEVIYKPKDEAEARDIESKLSMLRGPSGGEVYVDAVFSGSVSGTLFEESEFADTAIFTVDTIRLVGKGSDKALFTLGAKELGPIVPKSASTRKALKMAEPKSTGGYYF